MSASNFVCFNNNLSKYICNQILSGKTYKKIDFIRDVKTILDVGANVGASAVYFSKIYPDAQIYAFEPAKAPYNLLEKNIELCSNIKKYNFGLYSEDKNVPLYQSRVDSVTGSVGRSVDNSDITEKIELKDIKKFLNENNIDQIDILKIDTEGCELPIFKAILDTHLLNIKVIYVEYHSESDRIAIDEMLSKTHVLGWGSILFPHRGEFCYVIKSDNEDILNKHLISIEI